MKKFLVLYLTPYAVIEEWKKTDPETRAEAEKKMQGEWGAWMRAHSTGQIETTSGVGATKRVTKEGTADAHNDVMLYSVVEAESSDEAAKMFEGHPHFGIPEATIEVMQLNPLTGME